MNSQIQDFIDRQQTLLNFIETSRANGSELFEACRKFLKDQEQLLPILEENRRIHMNERGKLDYRLASEEQVSLSRLNELYSNFAKPLDYFIQLVTRIAQKTSTQELACFKLEAIGLVKRMLKICLVLDKQPVCINYGRQNNESPNLLFLGVNRLSNIEISNLLLNAVSESDLFAAQRDGLSLESVGGFQAFNVKQAKQSKASSKLNESLQYTSKNLGTWSIQKDQLNIMEKGSAHKDFLRLRYTVQIKYLNTFENLMLLSLPFNIRKSSCQLFTFTGALMWYFYTTDNPYETFNVIDRLPTEMAVKMVTTRIEVIGRAVSPRAQDFFTDRITNLSSNGKVELETLAKGPSTNKEDHNRPSDKTRSEDEAIECYGFFTWFFALAKSLEVGGYLNKLWTLGHIYDICDFKHVESLIQHPQFGFQTVILRPSMSTIANYQGEVINMGLAFFFKQFPHHHKVFSLNLSMEEVKSHGLYKLLTRLPLEFIYLSDDVQSGLEVLDSYSDQAVSQDKQYHGTRFQMSSSVQLSGPDAKSKHCPTCRCDREDANSVCSVESQAKKVRTPSGNSDSLSSVSDLQSTNLLHKHRGPTKASSNSIEDWRSLVAISNGFDCLKMEQVASPSDMTAYSSPRSNMDCATGSPESSACLYMSPPQENCIPSFEFLLSNGPESLANTDKPDSSSDRDQLISHCREVFNAVSSRNFPNMCDELIKLVTTILLEPQQTADEENKTCYGNDTTDFLPIGYQTSPSTSTQQTISSPPMVPNDLTCLSAFDQGEVGHLMNLVDLNESSPFVE